MWDTRATLDGLTPKLGSYLLHINIPNEFLGTIGSLGSIILPPGDYIYLGSAKGPGGISKRVARHCRAEKNFLACRLSDKGLAGQRYRRLREYF